MHKADVINVSFVHYLHQLNVIPLIKKMIWRKKKIIGSQTKTFYHSCVWDDYRLPERNCAMRARKKNISFPETYLF